MCCVPESCPWILFLELPLICSSTRSTRNLTPFSKLRVKINFRYLLGSLLSPLAQLSGAAGALPTPPGLPGLPPVHAPPPPTGLGRPDSQPGTPNSQRSSPVHHTNGSSSSGGRDNGQNNWSFEEQFKVAPHAFWLLA